ncbi:MAG: DUF1343 domain-containing protein [bacterium]
MRLGIDILMEEQRSLIEGKRLGILAHAASVDPAGYHTVDRIADERKLTVAALFGPEHGLATKAQDMESVESRLDAASGIPIHSLYGTTLDSLKPTREMLANIDTLIIDLQDVGSRYYTYVWTALLCIEACAEFGKEVIVCDRPNPISGEIVEGPGIDPGFESFVGLASLPVRHGLTIGEIVHWLNIREHIDCKINVVQMEGWQRRMSWPDTGLAWIKPSPNMRSYTAALLYPGMCLVEATNLSEGRGTDTPFEIVGAPFFDTEGFVKAFEAIGLPGIHAVPTAFIPTRQKWMGRMCQGVRWVVSDALAFRPFLTGLAFVWLSHNLYKNDGFEWRVAPYEFVTERPAIDLLTGSSRFREAVEGLSIDGLKALAETPPALLEARDRALIY